MSYSLVRSVENSKHRVIGSLACPRNENRLYIRSRKKSKSHLYTAVKGEEAQTSWITAATARTTTKIGIWLHGRFTPGIIGTRPNTENNKSGGSERQLDPHQFLGLLLFLPTRRTHPAAAAEDRPTSWS